MSAFVYSAQERLFRCMETGHVRVLLRHSLMSLQASAGAVAGLR